MPKIESIKAGDVLPEREFKPDTVQSFLYNAALWNAHRIHYDYPYATEVEGYPGIVIAGPQMGDWLTQCVLDGYHGCHSWSSLGNLQSEMRSEKEYMGLHAALVVDYSGSKVKVPNGAYTSANGWVEWSKLYPKIKQSLICLKNRLKRPRRTLLLSLKILN